MGFVWCYDGSGTCDLVKITKSTLDLVNMIQFFVKITIFFCQISKNPLKAVEYLYILYSVEFFFPAFFVAGSPVG